MVRVNVALDDVDALGCPLVGWCHSDLARDEHLLLKLMPLPCCGDEASLVAATSSCATAVVEAVAAAATDRPAAAVAAAVVAAAAVAVQQAQQQEHPGALLQPPDEGLEPCADAQLPLDVEPPVLHSTLPGAVAGSPDCVGRARCRSSRCACCYFLAPFRLYHLRNILNSVSCSRCPFMKMSLPLHEDLEHSFVLSLPLDEDVVALHEDLEHSVVLSLPLHAAVLPLSSSLLTGTWDCRVAGKDIAAGSGARA
jgi:hypothetical protein